MVVWIIGDDVEIISGVAVCTIGDDSGGGDNGRISGQVQAQSPIPSRPGIHISRSGTTLHSDKLGALR